MRKFKIITLTVMFVLCVAGLSFAALPEALISAANNGDANAMYELGRAYQKGDGIAKNDTEAAKWFEKAAKLNHPRALFSLGYMYNEEIGVKYNAGKAFLYYKRAAELGNPAAMNNLGAMYNAGEDVCHDKALAEQWYVKAEKLGCPQAADNLRRISSSTGSVTWARTMAIAKSDDEYYKKSAYEWKAPRREAVASNVTKNIADTILVHAGFDVAKKARSDDGYMIVSQVAKDSEVAKGGMLEGCDLFQIDNMNTKQFSYDEVTQYILKSAEKKAVIMIVFLTESGATKRLDIKLK